ncbi:glycosyltransferase family 2 protein [Acetobacter tropicalis]|uniref:glycosyltransferase family 2 protein n=3 Tax=Acetobacter tropicalis TaxID=104102 RepID=UPI0006905FD2|nr:glycosyltransferase family 2 protein [Acetobacter tropicalis]KAA8389441.1 glycosyltransferase family 2 protein [Acetobacter tropicalis]KAA8390903.1 glycosyltransferase family 2 protein [Acetobacter tropicalis]MDO8170348.1 glycosyltransferase family 2 protein [Acetobacter tropicalis]
MRPIGKLAIALFVKDEVHDIAGWIAWHSALGVEKFYIYDDYSTDGTYQVIKSISDKVNIEYYRSNIEKEGNFYYRQRDSFFDAAEKAKNHYEWIAFLDGDEYLSLSSAPSIVEFLDGFDQNCSAIALSWRIFGSSSRVLKDNVPIYRAFKHHSREDFGDNALVKSIVRPEKLVLSYENPHKFIINSGIYVDALGQEVAWNGATKKVTWEGACVNHYICRSMEHYIGRIKRRIGVDLSNTTNYWNHFDRNEIFFSEREDICNKADKILFSEKKSIINSYISKCKKERNDVLFKQIKYSQPSDEDGADIYKIFSNDGEGLYVNNIDGHLVKVPSDYPVFGIIYRKNRDVVYLVRIVDGYISDIKYHIISENRKNFAYSYNIEHEGEEYIYLRSPETQKLMCFIPKESGNSVDVNRETKSLWERAKIAEIEIGASFHSDPSVVKDFDSAWNWLSASDSFVTYNDFVLMFSGLPSQEKEKLNLHAQGVFSWLL